MEVLTVNTVNDREISFAGAWTGCYASAPQRLTNSRVPHKKTAENAFKRWGFGGRIYWFRLGGRLIRITNM